ncbi:uncharacterized protein LOC116020861 [Ipomoea triloba]|uniref:uncharacterized protein LOC116020861 n=1 Tax=Ipomoea triloba TaxID=35885 RepID=UPI00125CF8B7|nr:uncharacterized protein LOC116020861 [Ipomoea triloba]
MIQPLYTLVFSEVAILLLLLFKTPLRNPLVMLLGRFKRGRGPVIAKTAGGTLFMVLISIFYNMSRIKTDHLLLANHLLEASLLGFSLFLAMMIDRIHYYIKELQTMRKDLEAATKQIHTRSSKEIDKTASKDD